MPWDDLRRQAEHLKLDRGAVDKEIALVALHATPENLNEVIGLLCATNLGMVAHVCGSEVQPDNTRAPCQEYELPMSMKYLVIAGLMALRDRELARKEKAS
jgi:hypothetical protein